MQYYKLLTLSSILLPTTLVVHAATTNKLSLLRGGPISQSTLITRYNHGLDLPPPNPLCLSQSESLSDCIGSKTSVGDDGDGAVERCVWCPDPRSSSGTGDSGEGLCLSEFDVEMAMEVMAFPCRGYVRKEDREESKNETEEAEEETSTEADETDIAVVSAPVPDFSCFSQAWGESIVDAIHLYQLFCLCFSAII